MSAPRYKDIATKVVLTEAQIKAAISKAADKIAADFAGKVSKSKPLVLICVLKGAYLFASDLARCLCDRDIPVVSEFICVSSYGSSATSSGEVRMLLDVRHPLSGLHCLIVEDILDSGRTVQFLRAVYATRQPASLRVCVLLDKPSGRKVKCHADYCCSMSPDGFLVGYGLDYNEQYRNLRDIICLKPEVYCSKVSPSSTSHSNILCKL